MIGGLLGVALAYLVGSVPAAYLAGRAHGVDLRRHGSGNLGATNAWRVLGWKTGLAVYLFDTLKGYLPTLLLPVYALDATVGSSARVWWALAFGVAAIAGHVRPVFLRGAGGGKGVATAGGVFAALVPKALAVAFATFVVVFGLSGYVSLGSLSAAVALPIAIGAMYGARHPAFGVSVAIAAFVFWTHRANVGRLRRGEESRFSLGRRRGAKAGRVRPEAGAAPGASDGREDAA